MKNVLQFMSSLLLPLVLGIFTVVITFHQQKAAQLQRLEDQEAAQQQRNEDRQTTQHLRELERNLSDERYLNDVLDAYIKDMAVSLDKNNGSIITNPVVSTLARTKTLNVFEQLDSQRNIRVIRFFSEAKQLTETHNHSALDLSIAELRDIDFRNLAIKKKK